MEGANGVSTRASILEIRDLRLAFGAREVLRGVDLTLDRGSFTALMGLSGVGKTSILRAIVALDPFTAGTIDVDGVRLAPGPLPRESHLRALRRKVGMVFQLHHLFEHLSATENITLALVHALGIPRARAQARAAELLESLQVSSRARALPRELSGGEAQRVAIARALATDPPLLLLDEPAVGLAPPMREQLGRLIRRLARERNLGILLIEHAIELVMNVSDRVVVLNYGAKIADAPPAAVRADKAVLEAYLGHG